MKPFHVHKQNVGTTDSNSVSSSLRRQCPLSSGSYDTIKTTYLIYTSAKDEVSFLIPLECKYRTFVLAQSAGQVP